MPAYSHGNAYAGYLVGFLPIPSSNWDLYAKGGAAHWKLDGNLVNRPTTFQLLRERH